MPVYATVPAQLVSSMLASTPVLRDDLRVVRDRQNANRYIGVYRHVRGQRYNFTAYRARVFKFWELGSNFQTLEDAARAIVAFYKANYGERWQIAFQNRRAAPWRVRAVRRRAETGNGIRIVGYAADVYLRGTPVGVTQADVNGRSPGATNQWLWPSSDAARNATRIAMAKWFAREAKTLTIPAQNLLFWRA